MKKMLLFACAALLLMTSCADRKKDLYHNRELYIEADSALEEVTQVGKILSAPDNFSLLDTRISRAKAHLAKSIEECEGATVKDDVLPMNNALIEYMKACNNELDVYSEMADRASKDELTKSDLREYRVILASLERKRLEAMKVLDRARSEFVNKHSIRE